MRVALKGAAMAAGSGSRSRRNSRGLRALSAALLLTGAAGCGGVIETGRAAREDAEAVGRELSGIRDGAASPGWSAIRVSERPWLAIEPVEPVMEHALPEALRGGNAVTLPLGDISGDEALAARIEAAADLEVRLAGKSSAGAPLRDFARALGDGWTPAAGVWSGPLPRLLDAWAAAGGYRWRYAADGGDRWTLYATPDTVDGAEVVEVGHLPSRGVLKPAPLAGVTGKRLSRAAAALVVAGAGLAAWGYRDAIVETIRGAPEETGTAERDAEPTIAAAIDSAALVAGCREAIRRHTPGMPGWELRNLSCTARFGDSKLVAVRPALKGRPVLVARWAMRGNGEEALLRRVAERHLTEWRAARPDGELEGSVVGREAWVAVALPPVTVAAAAARAASRLALRASLDRRFGLRAWRLEHARGGGPTRIVMREPLSEIGALVEGVRGFEVTRLARGSGGWVIEGRRADPVEMTLRRFARLRSWLQ